MLYKNRIVEGYSSSQNWHNNLSSADVFLFTSVSDVMFIFNYR